MSYQYDFFEEEMGETHMLRMEFEELRESQDKLRRGLFARHDALGKLIISQQAQIDALREIVMR